MYSLCFQIFPIASGINMLRSTPSILTPHAVLAADVLSTGLRPDVGHQDPEVDMNDNTVLAAKHSVLHSYLVSEVERNVSASCQLSCVAIAKETSPSAQLDTVSLDDIRDVSSSMEEFFDNTDAELEIDINSLLAQIKDLRDKVLTAMATRASFQAMDWRRSFSGGSLPLAPSGSYIRSINLEASSSNCQNNCQLNSPDLPSTTTD